MNIFEKATKQKLRFTSVKGPLTVEDLWDLPLQAKDKCDLDNVARTVSNDLKAVTEESFVATKTSPAKARYELQLEIVKHVIAVKLAAEEEAKNRAQRESERQKLLDALASKKDAELNNLSADEIQKRLAALDAASAS